MQDRSDYSVMEPIRRERAQFRELLGRFKRRGCNLLIVGETKPAVRRQASRRLFGAPLADRCRLLITVGNVSPDRWLPADGNVIDADVLTRNSPTDGVGESLRTTLTAKNENLEATPGECRVGITSIAPLLDESGGASLLEELRNAVVQNNGIGHYHLEMSLDVALDRSVDDGFDAVLELRKAETPEERWHVPSHELTTPWVPMES